jgi:hypothetical protein
LKDVPYSITKKYQPHDKDVFDQGESPADGALIYEDMPSRDFYTVHYGFPGSDKYTEQALVCSGKEHELEVREIKVTAKIDAEYKVVLLDKGLSGNQEPTEEKIVADGTRVELWLEQHPGNPVFDQGAKIEVSGVGGIDAFLDKEMTKKLNISNPIPKDKITGGKKLKVWLKGTRVGKFKLKLSPVKSSNSKFVIQPPAEMEMGVVELKMEIYEQDIAEIKSIQVDPDQEPTSAYHNALKSQVLPGQIALSDKDKVKKGRLLHVQNKGNFSRSKVVIKALTADQFPSGCDYYRFMINSSGKSGKLKLFNAEFGGTEIKLPLKLKKGDLNADKTYWVEGASESRALRDTVLDMGMDRPKGGMAKTPKRHGDWGRYTVVKLEKVELKVVTSTGKAEVWDKSKGRFYVNLDGPDDARKLMDKSGQRDVKVVAKLSRKIPDVTIHFTLIPNKRNWDRNHWGANVIGFEFSKVDRDLKHIDKNNYKDLLHLSTKTNTDGNAEIQNLVLSRIGGDVFKIGTYLDQDPHLSKYIDGHATLSKRSPVLSADQIEVWRKFYIQNTFNKNITLPNRILTSQAFEKCFIEIEEVDEEKYDPTSISGLVEHELWQFDMSGSTRKVVCVGDINKAKFTSLFKPPKDTTKPKAHMVMCDVQWDSQMGSPKDFSPSTREFSINYKNSAGNSYLGVFDPPLGGGSIVRRPSIWVWNDGSKTHQGNLNDSNVAIEKSRGHYSEVKIKLPAVCPPSCPCGRPGTAINPTPLKKASVRLTLKGATGPWAGESGRPGDPQCLIVINNDVNEFNNTIAHEIGHLFKAVRKDTNWKGIPDHPHQYEKHGGQGSHCKEDAAQHPTRVDQDGNPIFVGGTCVMFHVAVGNTVFCDNCSVDMRVRDVSDTFRD